MIGVLRFLKLVFALLALYGPGWFLISYAHDWWVQDDDARCYREELRHRSRTVDPNAMQLCHLAGNGPVATTIRAWGQDSVTLLQKPVGEAIGEVLTVDGPRWVLCAIPYLVFFFAGWMRWGPFGRV